MEDCEITNKDQSYKIFMKDCCVYWRPICRAHKKRYTIIISKIVYVFFSTRKSYVTDGFSFSWLYIFRHEQLQVILVN